MADGVTVATGNNTSPPNSTKFATDDAGAAGHVPLVKIAYSADGSSTAVDADSSGLKVQVSSGSVTASGSVDVLGDTAHDAADSGDPVKVGFKAANALPTAVANADRANGISDLFGRQLVSHIDPAMQVWKRATRTTSGTTVVWDPSSGKRIALTYLSIGTSGTTAGKVTVWLGANGDSTYDAGTDQVVFEGDLTPTASNTPASGNLLAGTVIFCTTADHELKLTTGANTTVYLVAHGYEW